MKSDRVEKLREEIETLKYVVKNILWMSIRYAHKRRTFAPYIVRDCVERLRKLYPNESFLRPDATIKSPTEEDLRKSGTLRYDWLDDLFESPAVPQRTILQEGDVVIVEIDNEELEAVIRGFNNDGSITVESKLTSEKYKIDVNSIRRVQNETR